MTIFNPENKETLTIGEILDPAMCITDPVDAGQYFAHYVNFIQKYWVKEPEHRSEICQTPTDVARINIGYYASYYDLETSKRVQLMFGCGYPIFGCVNTGELTHDQIKFNEGIVLAEAEINKGLTENLFELGPVFKLIDKSIHGTIF